VSTLNQHRGRSVLLASALLVMAIAFAVARVGLLSTAGGLRVGASWVMTDFYSAAYNPVHSVLEGQTPYDRDSTFPPYAPLHLVVHLPFALLPPQAAAIGYFLFTVILTLALAVLALRLARLEAKPQLVLALAAAVLLSRPGHWTLLLGQVSILLTVLSYLIFVHERDSPALAGWALCGVLLKPTYGVPVALLLWAWGRRKIAALGLGLAIVVNLPLLALFAQREGGLGALIRAAVGGYRGWQEISDVNPATSNTRTDAVSLISRFVGNPLSSIEQVILAGCILVVTGLVLRRLAKFPTESANVVAVSLICVATSLVGFHRGYDLVLLTAPFLMVARPASLPRIPPGVRAMILLLFSVPALNWVATESVLARWQPSHPVWLGVTSLNGLCILILFITYLLLGVREGRDIRKDLTSDLLASSAGSVRAVGSSGY